MPAGAAQHLTNRAESGTCAFVEPVFAGGSTGRAPPIEPERESFALYQPSNAASTSGLGT